MTAMSLLAQRDAAYILTDGALYDEQGIVRALCSKVVIAEQMRLAIAPAGRCQSVELAAALDAAGAVTQSGVMCALPAIAQSIRAEAAGLGHTEPDLQLYVALWSERADEAQAWMLSTCALAHWGAGYVPGTWMQVDAMFGLDQPLSDVIGVTAAAEPIDMPANAGAIIDHQRRTRYEDGRYYVGGRGELVTVRRSGVTQDVVRRWPDRVGELIQLTADALAPSESR